MSTSAFATSAARKSRSTGGVRFPVLGAAAGNVGGTDVHADRSTQNAVVLSMTARRIAVKFRTPEKKWGAQWQAKFRILAIPIGRVGCPRQHTLYGWRDVDFDRYGAPKGPHSRRRVTGPGRLPQFKRFD